MTKIRAAVDILLQSATVMMAGRCMVTCDTTLALWCIGIMVIPLFVYDKNSHGSVDKNRIVLANMKVILWGAALVFFIISLWINPYAIIMANVLSLAGFRCLPSKCSQQMS